MENECFQTGVEYYEGCIILGVSNENVTNHCVIQVHTNGR